MPPRGALTAVLAGALLSACAGGTTTALAPSNPKSSPVPGGLTSGLIAFHSVQGIGVLDPSTGKQSLVVPLPAQGLRVTGPVWGPAARAGAQALYFTIHDDRPQETASSDGVVAYDWVIRADPFTGALEPIAAAPDPASEGPINLVAGARELAYTLGCCGDYTVNEMPFATPPEPPQALAHMAQAGSIYAEGFSPLTGWLVLKSSGGTWLWYEPEGGRTQELTLGLKVDDGPVAISDGDRLAAVAGGKVQVADLKAGGPLHDVPGSAGAMGLAWGPGSRLALANGGLTVVEVPADGSTPAPAAQYLAGAGVTAVSWSQELPGLTVARVRATSSPQPLVDALLAATRLPAADV